MVSSISVNLRFNFDVIFLKSSQRESSLMSSGMRKSFILILQSLNTSQGLNSLKCCNSKWLTLHSSEFEGWSWRKAAALLIEWRLFRAEFGAHSSPALVSCWLSLWWLAVFFNHLCVAGLEMTSWKRLMPLVIMSGCAATRGRGPSGTQKVLKPSRAKVFNGCGTDEVGYNLIR